MARILIIDDDESMLYLLRQILECAGHEVLEATDGAVGARLFRQERPEIVITDIFMPEQDGLETILTLKREFPTVKIIAISGGGQIGDLSYLEMTRKFGADRVLRKPFTPQAMLTTIQELIAKIEFSN
jgi:CheY-like chemotaxis protein